MQETDVVEVSYRRPPKARKSPVAKSKPKKKTLGRLKKELDAVFSKYVRKIGPKVCYTCGRAGTLQCGHFVSRTYLATRWEPDNCRPQCVGCNIFGRGQLLDFEENLIQELGASRVSELKQMRHQILKLSRGWYEEQIQHYTTLLSEGE